MAESDTEEKLKKLEDKLKLKEGTMKDEVEDLKNEVPLLLWLQGGPGASSLIGLFLELGPLSVRNESGIFKVRKNEYTWGKEFSLLFIDQPVGTGFSFTDNSDGYAKNLTMSSDQLYDALTQFFAIHGDYEENPFYITGESYAGIAVGNGFTDPSSMLYYSKYLFQLGLIDINARTTMEKIEEYTKSLIESKQYILAFSVSSHLPIYINKIRAGLTRFAGVIQHLGPYRKRTKL
nr:PREDICTED: venom serine carboxypeptidase-like isoform X2 [Bemisia tabaci]